jgi:hypothetical protein
VIGERWLKGRARQLAAASVAVIVAAVVGAVGASALTFAAPKTIGKAGESRGFPRVAVDSAGRGVVVWHNYGRRKGRIQAVLVGQGGQTGSPRVLSDPTLDASNPEVGIDGDGRATVVWLARRSGRIQWTRLAADGVQAPVQTLPGDGSEPKVAVNEAGAAVVAWTAIVENSSGFASRRLHAVLIRQDGSVGSVQRIGPAEENLEEVAIDALGRATFAWQGDLRGKPVVYVSRMDEDGNAGPARVISAPGRLSYIGSVAVDGAGVSTVAWSERSGRIRVARILPDGAPGAVRRLSGKGFNGSPSVVVDDSGRATVAWAGAGPLRWVRLSPSGAPGRRGSLKGASLSDMAVGRSGRVWIVWSAQRRRSTGRTYASVRAMRLSPDGKAGRTRTLSKPGEDVYDFQGEVGPELAVGGAEVARVVWPNVASRNPGIRLTTGR